MPLQGAKVYQRIASQNRYYYFEIKVLCVLKISIKTMQDFDILGVGLICNLCTLDNTALSDKPQIDIC